MTLQAAITQAMSRIARRDAETLLIHLLGRDRAWLLAYPQALLTAAELAAFDRLVRRRATHEPMQYLTGHQEFYGLDLQVTPAVLIPRPETELLVEAVLQWAQQQSPSPLRLIDVGTGSGAIALALATHLSTADIFALDLSPEALSVARGNAQRLGLATRIIFLISDLFSALDPDPTAGNQMDAIVSNPPYVPQSDAPTMQPEVRDFEPHQALFAGDNGLAIYERLIPEAAARLRPGGLLAMEFGFGQKAYLAALLQAWQDVQFLDDLAGIPRVVLATRPLLA